MLLILLHAAAELRAQNSSLQAGFTAYAQTTKHHSLLLARVQSKLEELEAAQSSGSPKSGDFVEAAGQQVGRVEELEGTILMMGNEIAELKIANLRKDARIEELEGFKIKMGTEIEELERRVNYLEELNGKEFLCRPILFLETRV